MSSGELAIAADVNEGNRRVPLSPTGDRRVDACVGVVGSEPFCGREGERGGGGRPLSPAEASVRRNSTHRRENDCMRVSRCHKRQCKGREVTDLGLVRLLELGWFSGRGGRAGPAP